MMDKNFIYTYLTESVNDDIKYSLIPGSFKPPHKGHYAMIKHYNDMTGINGETHVFISNPSPSKQRKTAINTAISAETVKEILELYCKNLSNTYIHISESTPVKDCYDFGAGIDSGMIIFGCSDKDNDINRWKTVKEHYKKNYPEIYAVDPKSTAVSATTGPYGSVSATDFRNVFPDEEKMEAFLPEHLSSTEKQWVINKLLS